MKKTTARDALDKLYEAFERHLAVSQECDNLLEDRFIAAEDALQAALISYNQALFDDTGMELPLDFMEDDVDQDAYEFIDNHSGDAYDDYDDDDNDLEDLDDDSLHPFDEDEYEVYNYHDLDDEDSHSDDSAEQGEDIEEEENPT